MINNRNIYKIFKFHEQSVINIGIEYNNKFYKLASDYNFTQLLEQPELIDSIIANHQLIELAISEVKLGHIFEPNVKIFGVGLNYQDHIQEIKYEASKYPQLFNRFISSFALPGQPLYLSLNSQKFDYEGELAIIIKNINNNIEIAGFTIANDVTARDYQAKTSQWMLGKNFDNSGALSPFLLLNYNLPNQDFNIETKINDDIRQSSSTKHMIFNYKQIINFISEAIELKTGDIILTGTPSGVGYKQSPPQYLKSTDKIEISISSIGSLVSYVA